ncbi:hypothetical protein EVAR_98455_1 [Eumeta japonica]|uniref:Uncharacterized protein n=1 Tax=Eumeta variegata TaxID=151549 RepID=A0A4C1YSC5_EUMVA|nr:hypothetical protein EVAR_98455_1 [Eumeta japonica]
MLLIRPRYALDCYSDSILDHDPAPAKLIRGVIVARLLERVLERVSELVMEKPCRRRDPPLIPHSPQHIRT